MNTKRLLIITSISGFITVVAASGYFIGRARASGIPATNAMTYSGVLTDTAGAPLTGAKTISVTLWDAVTAGTSACVVPSVAQTLVAGGFQVQLTDACTTAVHANPNLWAEVIVDSTSLGRTKLGAVPYAVEADHAKNADSATNATTANAAGGALKTTVDGLTALTNSQASKGYVRIGDTQIVWGAAVVNIVNGVGNSEYVNLIMPIAFPDATSYVVSVSGTEAGLPAGNALGRPVDGAELLLQYSGASAGPTGPRTLNWIALGRWK